MEHFEVIRRSFFPFSMFSPVKKIIFRPSPAENSVGKDAFFAAKNETLAARRKFSAAEKKSLAAENPKVGGNTLLFAPIIRQKSNESCTNPHSRTYQKSNFTLRPAFILAVSSTRFMQTCCKNAHTLSCSQTEEDEADENEEEVDGLALDVTLPEEEGTEEETHEDTRTTRHGDDGDEGSVET